MPETVAHVLGTLGTGGVPVVAHALLQRLSGWNRRLYYLTDRTTDPVARARTVGLLEAEGIAVRLVPEADARSKAHVVAQVAQWVAADGVSIVHTHSTRPNRYGRQGALQVPGVRVVAHYHNHYDDKWGGDGSPALDLERRLAPRTSHFAACSNSVRDHIMDRIGIAAERVIVLPNGVAAEQFRGGDGANVRERLGVGPRTPVIGAVGRVCQQKAPDDVLDAVGPLLRQNPDAQLWFVGAADDAVLAEQLRRTAAARGLAGRVRLLGYRRDMADVYAALDVVVLASRWEGFGLVVAEAMAAGRPVVATDVGGIREAVGPGSASESAALLVPAGDLRGLGRAVADVLDSPPLARRLAANAGRRAGDLGWDVAAGRVDALYRSLLAADRGVA